MCVPIFDADNHSSHLPGELALKIKGGNLARLMNVPAGVGAIV